MTEPTMTEPTMTERTMTEPTMTEPTMTEAPDDAPLAGIAVREGLSWSWHLDLDALVTALSEPAPWNHLPPPAARARACRQPSRIGRPRDRARHRPSRRSG